MRRKLGWMAALAVPALLLTAPFVGAQKSALDKELEKNTEKMVKAGQLVGQVMAVYEDKRMIRVKIGQMVQEFNPGAVQAIQSARTQLAQARTPQSMISAQQALAKAQADLYKAKMVYAEPEVKVSDDVIVRTRQPRPDFDEKGRLKKLGPKELKELKGSDPKLPGYKAEFGDLQADQIVSVHLVRKKGGAAAPKAPPKGKGKGKGKEGEGADLFNELANDNQPQASMIVIEKDVAPAGK